MEVPRSVLLIVLRQFGDVLLITPLLHSLQCAWPEAKIDVLVYRNTGQMLEGNPDCNHVIEVSEHPELTEYRRILSRLFRKYDLSISTQTGDRPYLFALWSANQRVGLIPDSGSFWKQRLNKYSVSLDNVATHTVLQNLRLAEVLGIRKVFGVVPPHVPDPIPQLGAYLPFDYQKAHYVVIHPLPMRHYKRWTEFGWKQIIAVLLRRVEYIVLTGGPSKEDGAFLQKLTTEDNERIFSLAGHASFVEHTNLLKKSLLYIGPDTAMTHLAAACGTPTVAIYGPSDPVKWGPWPEGQENKNPWQRLVRPYQKQGNVVLLQGVQPEERDACVPCREEGCDRHRKSNSICLQYLSASTVVRAVDEWLL